MNLLRHVFEHSRGWSFSESSSRSSFSFFCLCLHFLSEHFILKSPFILFTGWLRKHLSWIQQESQSFFCFTVSETSSPRTDSHWPEWDCMPIPKLIIVVNSSHRTLLELWVGTVPVKYHNLSWRKSDLPKKIFFCHKKEWMFSIWQNLQTMNAHLRVFIFFNYCCHKERNILISIIFLYYRNN